MPIVTFCFPFPYSNWDGKTKRFEFDTVSREVTVFNLSTSNNLIKVHFVSGSTGMDFASTDTVTRDANSTALTGLHFVPLGAGESVTFRAKCKEIYVTNISLYGKFLHKEVKCGNDIVAIGTEISETILSFFIKSITL